MAKPPMKAGIGVLSLGTIRPIVESVPKCSGEAIPQQNPHLFSLPTLPDSKAARETRAEEDGPPWALKVWKGDRKAL